MEVNGCAVNASGSEGLASRAGENGRTRPVRPHGASATWR